MGDELIIVGATSLVWIAVLGMVLYGGTESVPKKPLVLSPYDRMKQACRDLDEAWQEAQRVGFSQRPWVITEERRIVLTVWGRMGPEVVYDPQVARNEED